MSAFYEALDVFVLPSLSECLPFALLEAMAYALPVVATDVGGIPEVIVPGETGAICSARDATMLADAISPYVCSEDLRARHGTAGRERVEVNFSETKMAEATFDVYREMLCGRNSSKTHDASHPTGASCVPRCERQLVEPAKN
jgi:glycosyltransferase involved in cell wall biosynthesis